MNDFPITVRFPIHWSDMDAFGHVNNVCYFTWFEAARIAYMIRVGLVDREMRKPEGDAVGPIVAATSAEYHRPVRFPAELVVGARVTRIGTTSVTMEFLVEDANTGVAYAKGGSVIVTLRYADHQKVPVPAPVRAAIEAVEARSFP